MSFSMHSTLDFVRALAALAKGEVVAKEIEADDIKMFAPHIPSAILLCASEEVPKLIKDTYDWLSGIELIAQAARGAWILEHTGGLAKAFDDAVAVRCRAITASHGWWLWGAQAAKALEATPGLEPWASIRPGSESGDFAIDGLEPRDLAIAWVHGHLHPTDDAFLRDGLAGLHDLPAGFSEAYRAELARRTAEPVVVKYPAGLDSADMALTLPLPHIAPGAVARLLWRNDVLRWCWPGRAVEVISTDAGLLHGDDIAGDFPTALRVHAPTLADFKAQALLIVRSWGEEGPTRAEGNRFARRIAFLLGADGEWTGEIRDIAARLAKGAETTQEDAGTVLAAAEVCIAMSRWRPSEAIVMTVLGIDTALRPHRMALAALNAGDLEELIGAVPPDAASWWAPPEEPEGFEEIVRAALAR